MNFRSSFTPRRKQQGNTFIGIVIGLVIGLSIAVVVALMITKGQTPFTDKAPKNGEPCDDFLSCFACTSYTIVGSPADLHRLFSFYWYLEREAVRARSADWRAEFRNTMDLIDRFTADKFEAGMVATAKTRAKSEPLQFWADYTLHNREVKYD